MKIINFGSLNLDHVYRVAHTVVTGETTPAKSYTVSVGGKGLNQSIACARAGCSVIHAGCIGDGGQMLADCLRENRVDVSYLETCSEPQGHALIQVNDEGNNCIIIYGGSNQCVTKEYIDELYRRTEPGDYIVLQNEISNVAYIVEQCKTHGCKLIFNASPISPALQEIDYSMVSWLVINEIEGMALAQTEQISEILPILQKKYPTLNIILTLGEQGSVCCCNGELFQQEAFHVQAVDTTAAGDTFLGYCVAGLVQGESIPNILRTASAASALAVSTSGAAASIPERGQVAAFLASH